MQKKCCKVKIKQNDQKTEVEATCNEQTFLDICEQNNIAMDNACGGNGVCTTCLVKITEGQDCLSEHTENEMMMGFDPENNSYRLGCQCKPSGDCSIELP